jgi:hypothetical protein
MEPEPHYEDFRSLRRKIFEWQGAARGRARGAGGAALAALLPRRACAGDAARRSPRMRWEHARTAASIAPAGRACVR